MNKTLFCSQQNSAFFFTLHDLYLLLCDICSCVWKKPSHRKKEIGFGSCLHWNYESVLNISEHKANIWTMLWVILCTCFTAASCKSWRTNTRVWRHTGTSTPTTIFTESWKNKQQWVSKVSQHVMDVLPGIKPQKALNLCS